MTEVYVSGCATCGVNLLLVRRVLRSRPNAVVHNSKYDKAARERHAELVKQAGMERDKLPGIVVEGGSITRLEEWS